MAVGEESDEVEHAEGEEDFDGEDGDVGYADEAGGDAVEGEDGAGDEEDAEGGVDEGEVVAARVGCVVGGTSEAGAEDQEVVDAAADPSDGGKVVDPAHDEEEDVVKAHGQVAGEGPCSGISWG